MAFLSEDLPNALERPEMTRLLMRGVCRALSHLGYATLTEFTLGCGRRADVMALDRRGALLIVEVKSGPEDYLSDQKWQDYLDYCDRFYFAVSESFPRELVPEDCGLMIADGFGAVTHREPPTQRLNAARRRSESLRFARVAAERLQRLTDPR